jgi:periplasmic protein TonB
MLIMKTAKILLAAVLIFGFEHGFGMQTASPSPSPQASPAPSPSPKKLPQKIRVSQGVSDGMLIHRVEPVLPADAKKRKGDVVLTVVINREGNVVSATVLKVANGNPVLAQSALEAVRQWKYKPLLLNGEPLEVETTVTLHFKK